MVSEYFSEEELGKMLLKLGVDLCFWANFVHCCAGLIVSLFTVIYISYTVRFVLQNNFLHLLQNLYTGREYITEKFAE